MESKEAYYRAMISAPDGLPAVGRSARKLGIRVSVDIRVDAAGRVHPRTGGMSVSPGSVWDVPNHRRPRGMGRGSTGRPEDRVYELPASSIPASVLTVRLDPEAPELHAFVEPSVEVELEVYEKALSDTRNDWSQVWP